MGPRASLERRASPASLAATVASESALAPASARIATLHRAHSVAGFSLLRLSVAARLAIVAAVTALLWLAVWWALT